MFNYSMAKNNDKKDNDKQRQQLLLNYLKDKVAKAISYHNKLVTRIWEVDRDIVLASSPEEKNNLFMKKKLFENSLNTSQTRITIKVLFSQIERLEKRMAI